MQTFNQAVLAWMLTREKFACPAEVVSVVATGSDWIGSTDAGWHSEFEVALTYRDDRGRTNTTTVDAERLESLWNAVVGSFPAEAAKEQRPRRPHTWSEVSLDPRRCTSCGKRAADLITQPYCPGPES